MRSGRSSSRTLTQPVRFRESVDTLYTLGCRIFVEVGAGDVLTGLVGKCLADRRHVAIAIDRPGTHGVRSWWRAMAEIATLGLRLNFEALDATHGPAGSPMSETAGPAVVYVGGANLGKPYPPAQNGGQTGPATDRERDTATVIRRETECPSAPLAPEPVVARDDNRQNDLHARILEAQRLTQQAILESFSMTLRGMGGVGSLDGPDAAGGASARALIRALIAVVRATVALLADSVCRRRLLRLLLVPLPLLCPPLPPPRPGRAMRTTAATVLAVIAEKTGYPVEVLAPDMDLEADLGIDSIKRVEILAAVSQQVPTLDPAMVSPANIRRISDLLALLEDSSPDPHQAAAR